jgi:hypothetical protein
MLSLCMWPVFTERIKHKVTTVAESSLYIATSLEVVIDSKFCSIISQKKQIASIIFQF